MRIGLQYPIVVSELGPDTVQARYQEFFREVQWANDTEFDGIWVTEHHFSNYSVTSSPLLLLTQAAALAPNLRVGTAILVLPIWDPVRLVADVSTLDSITGGRFDLGIGRGYQPHEFKGFGVDPQKSRELFEESVELILQLFTKPDSTFAGQHHQVEAPVTVLPRPTQTPHPPIWMAASSPDSIKFAAKNNFHFMTPTFWTREELGIQRQFIEKCVEDYGTNVQGLEYEANRFVYCGTDPEELQAAVRASAWQTRLSKSLLQGATPVHGVNPEPGDIDGEPVANALSDRLLAGTPDQVIEQLHELGEVGITYVLAQFRFGNLPVEIADRSRELFAREVLPHVADIKSRPFLVGV
ncbi:LLM class flavin-dependent oxidoreductase [Streptomyces sp. NPDC001393]